MNEAVNFIKNRLTAPTPPNQGMSSDEIAQQQFEVEERLRRKKEKEKEEEEREFENHKPSQIDDDEEKVQTHTPKPESQPEPQEKADNRFVQKVRAVVRNVDDVIDETADELEERTQIAYQNAKAGTKKFIHDERADFQKATQSRNTTARKRSYKPLVSESDRARSSDFAIRDYERRRTPHSQNNIISERGFAAVDDIRQNPYIGFNDVNGYGELSRDAFSLSTSQFNFNLIGDTGSFGGMAQQNQFGGFNVKQESSFSVGYKGELGAFRHSKNESFSFLPKPPKTQPKRKNNKGRNSSRDFDISRLIF